MSRQVAGWLILAVVAVMAFALSCSSGSKGYPTAPGGGGALELNSGNIASGGVFSHTFLSTGTFNYHCTIHPSTMIGSVTVNNGAFQVDTVVTAVNMNTAYGNQTIQVGQTIHWHNGDAIAHTVTSF